MLNSKTFIGWVRCGVIAAALWITRMSAAQAQADQTFDWALPWGKVPASAVDQSSLNAPIEEKDRVSVRDGHFFTQAGQRVRFVGMNIVAGDCFPQKNKAEEIAQRLRRFGVNLVRLHQMDASWAEPNLWYIQGATARRPTAELSGASMDRLDYFIFQLARNGIYVDINFHTNRGFKGDNIPAPDQVDDSGKPLNYINDHMIDLQCKLIDQLLKHENRYTHNLYLAEPAIAMVELTNENSLFDKADQFSALPDAYRDALQARWNSFLKSRYGGNAGLVDAWSQPLAPPGAQILRNGRFEQRGSNWTVSAQNNTRGHLEPAPSRDDDDSPPGEVMAVRIDRRGNEDWNLQFVQNGLTLEAGKPYTLSYYAKSTRDSSIQVTMQLQQEPWTNLGLSTSVDLKTGWRKYTHTFIASSATLPGKAGLLFGIGRSEGDLILADVQLRSGGGDIRLPRDESVERGTISLQKPGPTRAGRDFIEFLMQVERDYAGRLRNQVRGTGAKMPIICSQASYGCGAGVLRELESDYIDMHAYWQHPTWPGNAWDMNNYRVENTSMTRSTTGGALANLASYRVEGKPFVVSEYDHPAPAESASEMMPMVFAMACAQDWDGVILFNYNHGYSTPTEASEWKTHVDHWFDQSTHGGKLSFLPTAARMFRSGAVAPLATPATLTVGREKLKELASAGSWVPLWDLLGHPMSSSFLGTHQVKLRVVDGVDIKLDAADVAPDEGMIRWNPPGAARSQFVVVAPAWRVVAGTVGDQKFSLGDAAVRFGTTPRKFGVFSLASLTDKPLAETTSMLLTIVDKVENRSAQWNRERTSAGNLTTTGQGGAMRASQIPAEVEIRIGELGADVWALTPEGTRRQKIASSVSDDHLLKFHVGPEQQTLWYEIAVRPVPTPPPPPATAPATRPTTAPAPAIAPSSRPAPKPTTILVPTTTPVPTTAPVPTRGPAPTSAPASRPATRPVPAPSTGPS